MQAKKKNILFIVSDDQGAWALGCAGNSEIQTPCLDRLAQEGTRLDRFYCASPVCSPARATLLTGRIPSQHGVHDWLHDETPAQAGIEYLRGQSGYTDVLAQAGYECGLSGKWHLGNSASPQKGFSHWYCHKSGGGPYYGAPVYKNGQLVREEGYITDAITEDAIGFLQQKREGPFYLQVGYTAPHSPWVDNHPGAYVALYEDCPFQSLPREPRHPDSIYLTDEVAQNLRANQMGYYAAVTAMDAAIGRLLAELERLGLAEDTLVVFTSDNGFSCGHHGFWGKGNGTFPINMYEDSVRVPFLARLPGQIPEGRVLQGVYSAYDWRPTLLELAGLADAPELPLPGASFAGALLGGRAAQDGRAVVYDEYGPNRMILRGKYKLVLRYPYGPDLLFDLEQDPGERHDLLEDPACSGVADALRRELAAWFNQYADPAIDGSREAVFGAGQTGLAGLWGNTPAYSRDAYLRDNPNYAPFDKG